MLPEDGLTTVVDLLQKRARQRPDGPAYTFLFDGEAETESLSYSELDTRAQAGAARLQSLGVPPGERALLLYPPGLEFIVAFFGCLYAGIVAVPACPPSGGGKRADLRLHAVVRDAKPRVGLTTASILSRGKTGLLPELAGAGWRDLDAPADGVRPEDWRPPALGSRTLAFLQYTSGSTSSPKGVLVTHENVLHNEEMIRCAFGHSAESRIVGWLPLYHDMGLIGTILQPLYLGVPCVLMSPMAFLRRPVRWLAAISRYRATTSGGPNFAYDLCVQKVSPGERAGLDLSSWSVAFNGSEPVCAESLERFATAFAPCGFRREAFYPCYGLAEATLFVTGGSRPAAPVVASFAAAALKPARPLVGCGHPWAGQRVVIVDPETRRECPPDRAGEIWVAGASVASGYWGAPEETERDFQARLVDRVKEGPFLRTGDLGLIRDGELFVTGRLKDLIILRGRNYYPQDIEATAQAGHPALRSAGGAAFAVDGDGGERLVVVHELERRAGRGLDVAAVAEAVRRAVAEEHEAQVHDLVLLEPGTIPRTTSGKIQRALCRSRYQEGGLAVVARSCLETEWAAETEEDPVPDLEAVAALDPGERRRLLQLEVLQEVAAVLRVPAAEIGPGRTLAGLGLDSLAAVDLQRRLASRFGVALPLARLLDGPVPVASLANEVESRLGEAPAAEAPPLTRGAEEVGELPLSWGQKGLWFLQSLAPESAAWNIVAAARIHGDLDEAALRRAFQALADRHPALRTTFESTAGEPRQRVHERLEPGFLYEDATDWPESLLDEHLEEEAYRPFDLAAGPLLRLGLWRRGPRQHAALLAVHHIVADFWSMTVVTRELDALYACARGAPEPVADPPALRPGDHARWQERMLAGPRGERLWGHWQQRLSGDLPVLELPADRPRPLSQGFRGAACRLRLDPRLTESLLGLARARETTLYVVLLASFYTLLHRSSHQDDLLVGSPAAGRNAGGLSEVIGYFVNPMALRANLSGSPTFARLLEEVREEVLASLEHQDYPFPLLAERLRPKHDGGTSSLVRAMFVLQSPAPGSEALGAFALGEAGSRLRLGDLLLESVALRERRAQLDLTLMMARIGDGLGASWQYDTDLFDATTIARLACRFETLLEGIAGSPGVPVSDLPLLQEAERQQLFLEWNDTATEAPQEEVCLHRLFETQVERAPAAWAVVCDGERLSYAELNTRANRLARHLRALGVGREVRVGICVERSLEMVVGLLGILKAGGAYVPLDPESPRSRLALVLEEARASVLVTQERLVPRLPAGAAKLVRLDADREAIDRHGSGNPVCGSTDLGLAFVMFTSGSTGRPKAVGVVHRAVARLVRAPGYADFSGAQVFLQLAPLAFDASTLEIWAPLANGGCLAVMPPRQGSPEELARAIEGHRVTTLWLTAGLFHLMVEERLEGLASLRQLLTGGDVVSPRHVAAALEAGVTRVVNGYGPTENTTFTCCHPMTAAPSGHRIPIGRPLADTRVYLLDRHLTPVPLGLPGELCVGGDGLARGYLNGPELTAESFVPDPCGREPGGRLYRTGDLARYLPDGALEFLGRNDRQVKIRGFRVSPGEIEAALGQHPAVRQSAVLARTADGECRLEAYVVPAREETPSAAGLRAFLAERLPGAMVPALFIAVPALPLTPNGKVDWRALLAAGAARPEPAAAPAAPSTPVEEVVAGIWCDVLSRDSVGADEDFFELGGHSLLAARVVSQVQQALGVDLPLRVLFDAPTVAGVAAAVAAAGAGGGAPLVRVPRERELPLSFAQQRLWFLDRLAPGNPFYNVAAAVRLSGPLDVPALAASLAAVVGRHEALRTTFPSVEGQPVQAVAPASSRALPLVDLLGAGEPEAARLARDEGRRAFDLERGPLLRTVLLRMAGEEHVLLLTLHHIVFDAWSLEVLIRELATLYPALTAGRLPLLPVLPLQYADFAHWQRRWLQGEALDSQLVYWRKRLAGARTVLELPADRQRPRIPSFRGASLVQRWHELDGPVSALCRRGRATPFMTVLAAFQVLVHRYAGEEDFLLGAPVANRSRRELEGLIGFFANTLVIRSDLGGASSFDDLLGRVRDTVLEAFAHQDLPFERLVEELETQRDPSRAPLVQVLLQMRNAPLAELKLEKLVLRPVESGDEGAKFDLVLNAVRVDRGLAGMWTYSTDLFDATTVLRMAGHLRILLAAAGLGRPLAELPLLSEPELHQLRVEWNTPAVPTADICLHELFETRVREAPEATALVFASECLSYGELNARANRLAHRLLAAGAGRGTRVGLCLERSAEMVVAVLAVLKAGGAYVPLDPAYPRDRLAFMLADSRVPVLLTRGLAAERLPEPSAGMRVVRLDPEDGGTGTESRDNPAAGVTAQDLAYIIYTSGSTGEPKGVAVPHANVVRLFTATDGWFHFGSEDTWTLFHSYAFDFSVWELWGALLHGGRLVVVPYWVSRSPQAFRELLRRDRVTVLNQTPSAFRQLVRAEGEALAVGEGELALRLVILGGEAADPASSASWFERHAEERPRLVNMYGITETTVHVTCRPLGRADLGSAVLAPLAVPGMGRAIPGLRIDLLDVAGRRVPLGAPGEIHVGGGGLAEGYVGRPAATAERFLPDPFGAAGARLYRTGDLARYRPDGDLEYLGRIDNQVKIRGFRIETGEIEAALGRHPAVREAVVLARKDPSAELNLVAFVVPAAAGAEGRRALTLSGLRDVLAGSLPQFMLPSALRVLEELPLTASGKVDRRALLSLEIEPPAPGGGYAAPGTELERFLAGLWSEVLEVGRVGLHDDFFELGGNSISGAVLINRLQKKLGEIVHVVAIFDASTVAGMSSYLLTHYADAVAARWPGEVPDRRTPRGGGEGWPRRIGEEEVADFRRRLWPLPAAPQRGLVKNPPALFILSPPRSGSTLLRVMLGGHPRLFAPPELELLSFRTLAERREAFQGRDSFWLEGADRAVMEALGCTAGQARELIGLGERQGLGTWELYRRLQGWIAPRMLVDKTPSYTLDPEVLRQAEEGFESPLYIHLVRHPQGMIRSFEEAKLDQVFFRREHPFSRRRLAELIWLVSQRNIAGFLRGLPAERHCRVRFEDLVSDPEGTLARLCAFLGLEHHPDMSRPYQRNAVRMTDGVHAGSRMLGDVKFHEHSGIDAGAATRWRQLGVEDDLGDITWEVAGALGYERETGGVWPGIEPAAWAGEPAPLSFAQERLWFLDQLDPGSPAYNVAAAVRLAGWLDRKALARSVEEIVRRHAALRTTFAALEGRPVQRVAPGPDRGWPVVDLRGLPPARRDEAARVLTAEEAAKPFDLAAGPLLRTTLLQLAEREHLALLTLHHIVCDGWSIGVFLRELSRLYRAFGSGEPAALPVLPIQYPDFARWQRRRLSGEVLEEQLAYWRQRLAGAPEVLELATDRPHPAVQRSRGAVEALALARPLAQAVEAFSRLCGATVFITLLAAFKTLLLRYTGQEDIVVGSPIANRNRPEVEDLIGLFANTLALRSDLRDDPGFLSLVARVREAVLGDYKHQDLPFETLVAELRPERSLSRTPLFQAAFLLRNDPLEALALPGLTASPLEMPGATAKFDLTLTLTEAALTAAGGGLAGSLEYDSDLFDRTTVRRMARHFEILLAGIAADPGRRLSDLPLLTAAEEAQLRLEWNDGAADRPGPERIHELFEAQVERTPDAVAVEHGEVRWTYRGLNQWANRLAHHLRALGVTGESLVGLAVERSPELLMGMLGILKAGAAYVPLDLSSPPERLAAMMKEAALPLLLTEERLLAALPLPQGEASTAPRVLCLDRERGALAGRSAENLAAGDAACGLAYVMFTSGSTGRPRAVGVEQRGVVRLVRAARYADFGPRQVFLQLAPASFDASTLEVWAPLLNGGRLVLFPGTAPSLAELADALERHGVTSLWLTAGLFHQMVESRIEGLRPVSQLFAGGDVLSPESVNRVFAELPGCTLINGYGPTENTTFTCCHTVGEPVLPGGSVPIGRPIPATRAYVLDRSLRPVPVGVSGELCVGGDGLARGYLNRPEQTAERFVPDPFGGLPGERLYRTGDLVSRLPDGRLRFLGRLDRQVKLRGFRVEPGEVEAALTAHPAVREAAVVARGEAVGGRRLVAYVVAVPKAAPGTRELRSFLQKKLPACMIPAAFVPLAALPLTANGKVDRLALSRIAPAPGRETARACVAPRTAAEEILACIWAEVLGLERVGIEDDFFASGGHSLLATQVISRLHDAFRLELPLRALFDAPTVAELARRVESGLAAGQDGGPPLLPAGRQETLPLSFSQQRLWSLDRLYPGIPAYNIPLVVGLAGRLDGGVLERVLSEVRRRHEVLRTSFHAGAEQPVQWIDPPRHEPLPVVALGSLAAAARRREVMRLAAEEARWRFDLSRGPLLRAALLSLAPEEHVLLLTLHHIIADGWSLGVLLEEVAALYGAFLRGEPSPLAELPVQYADFAVWQRRWLQGPVLERQLVYWRERLDGVPALLALPTDRSRPAVQTFHGGRRSMALSGALSGALGTLSRGERATLFMTLLAGFAVLLARYAGQEDFAIGSPVANRNRLETEGLIGFFVNLLALRLDLSGAPTFRELLGRVRDTALGAYAHQDLPFEKLVDELRPDRSQAVSPFFTVLFVQQNTPLPALEMPGLVLTPLEVETGAAKFDLTLALIQEGEGLRGSLEYNTDLYDLATIERLAGHFLALLRAAVAAPDRPLSEAQLLSGCERQQLLVEWNATSTSWPHGAEVHRLFEAQAASTPSATALLFGDEELSYRELNRRANQVARHLASLGVGPEVVVGLAMERGLDLVIGMLGILKAGGAYLPLDPTYPAARLAFMLEDARISVLLTQRRLLARLPPHSARVVCLDRDRQAIAAWSEENLEDSAGARNLAYVIYTSGSTGRPKGVMISHESLTNFLAGMDGCFQTEGPGTWLAVSSISFDIAAQELLWPLTRSFRVVVQGERPLSSGAAVLGASGRGMEFSLFYFASGGAGGGDKYRLLLEGAKFADRRDFAAVWTPERHFHAFGGLYPNPSVTGAAVAAVTQRVHIRAGSVVLPLHNPVRVAEEWSVIDNLSGGRAAVSFASGWHADDFVLAPANHAQRKSVMLRDIDTVRRLWRGEPVRLVGGSGQEVDVRIFPKPLQAELPVWLTAAGNPETFRLAGELGANLLTHLLGQSVEELARNIGLYRRAWREHGHGSGEGQVTLMLHTFVGDDLEAVREQVRGPFLDYLRSSTDLLRNLGRSLGRDVGDGDLTEEDFAALREPAFERFFATSGLMGTRETCLRTVERLKAVGVDEVACLIDFGIEPDAVLASLEALDELRQASNRPVEEDDAKHSLARQLVRHRVTHLQSTPSMAAWLTRDPSAAPGLRLLQHYLLGGEALPASLAAELSRLTPAVLHNLYGPTETTVWSATHRLAGRASDPIPIGRPLANTQIYVLDPHLCPAPAGVAGQVAIAGAGVARGYLNRPEATAERFAPNPFGVPGTRLYLTGDLARFRPDGELDFLGRLDQQVKIRGYRIEPGEVEAILRQHPAVGEAAVVAREDVPGDLRLVAYVAAQPGRPVPALRVAPPERERLLSPHRRYTLPNGMVVAHYDARQARGAYQEIFVGQAYLRHGVSLTDGCCIFDVGSNAGFFSLFASQVCRPATIYAFEPLPPNFEILRANAALYGENVKVFQCGLGARSGTAEFTFYPHAAGLSGVSRDAAGDRREVRSIVRRGLAAGADGRPLLTPEQIEAALEEHLRGETYTCRLTTLSDAIREQGVERIDLLKIDVEKSEVEVLNGIADGDWSKIRQVAMEVHGKDLLAQVTAILESRGYEVAVDEALAVEDEAGGVHVYMLYAGRPLADPAVPVPPVGEPTAPSPGELRAFLEERLPAFMVPATFVLLDAVPLTPNGKLDRRALPPPEGTRTAADVPYAAPATAAEELIAGIWREILRADRIGIDDNFFEAGGNSLSMALTASALQEALGRQVSVIELFRFPTIRSLAEHLTGGAEAPAAGELDGQTLLRRESMERRRQLRQERRSPADRSPRP